MKILTFDIEDWFHILDNPYTKSEDQWINFESRIQIGLNKILQIIEENNVTATFFVVGWICEKYPNLVREISNRGFEIGSHTHMHQLVYEQDRSTFNNDVEKSIKTIEDCVGKKVKSFRAPGFSITEENKWAFEILYENGIRIDSSVFPASRAHGGFPNYKKANPSILKYNGIELKEFPINTYNVFGKPVVFSGGGYFRLFPYEVIKKFSKESEYIMTYFHPRDFDDQQPMLPGLSLDRKIKSYVGLKRSGKKLTKWLNDFDFTDIKTADRIIDWDNVKNIKL